MEDTKKMENQEGRAYLSFGCKAPRAKVEAELLSIMDAVKTPRNLELSLTEDASHFKLDSPVISRGPDRNYKVVATNPKATNKQTADRLAAIGNQLFQSPVYREEKPFKGNIVYEDRGKYVSRE